MWEGQEVEKDKKKEEEKEAAAAAAASMRLENIPASTEINQEDKHH